MNDRIELHDKLKQILGSEYVYFQPPESIKMVYPCIVYAIDDVDIKYADNKPYLYARRYILTVIDKDPDSKIPNELLLLPLCSFSRAYTGDNLNHWVFILYI